MQTTTVKCPSCGGPQPENLVVKKKWNCEYCGDFLDNSMNEIVVVPEVHNTTIAIATDTTVKPENPLFTIVSIIYLFVLACAFLSTLPIWGFDQKTVILLTRFATDLYIAISGFALAKVELEKLSEPSDPTILALLLWMVANIILMIVGFPLAILTRIFASTLCFIVGLIIGGLGVNVQSKSEKH